MMGNRWMQHHWHFSWISIFVPKDHSLIFFYGTPRPPPSTESPLLARWQSAAKTQLNMSRFTCAYLGVVDSHNISLNIDWSYPSFLVLYSSRFGNAGLFPHLRFFCRWLGLDLCGFLCGTLFIHVFYGFLEKREEVEGGISLFHWLRWLRFFLWDLFLRLLDHELNFDHRAIFRQLARQPIDSIF